MERKLKRISILVGEDQYEALAARALNISGLVRDLIDDHISDHKVTLAVSEETYTIYDQVVANTGSSDRDLERYFKESLKALLAKKIEDMKSLQKTLDQT